MLRWWCGIAVVDGVSILEWMHALWMSKKVSKIDKEEEVQDEEVCECP